MARDELARGRQLTAAARALRKTSPRLATDAKRARFDGYMTQLETEETDMPPKGQRAMGEDTTPIAVRLPRSIIAMIDEHVDRMRKQYPDLPISRVHALSNLIRRAREALAADVTVEVDVRQEDIPRRRRVASPLDQDDQDVEDMPLEPPAAVTQESVMPASTTKAAQPKAAAKKRTATTTKGR